MSSRPETTKRDEYILSTAATGMAYATLIIGYLFTILSSTHLTPFNFLVFTALQAGYFLLLRWIFEIAWDEPKRWQTALGIALLVLITQGVSLLSFTGLQWDWLLFLVTIALIFSFQQLRLAIMLGVLVYVMAAVNLDWLNHWNWSSTYLSLLQLLPAFAFVAIF